MHKDWSQIPKKQRQGQNHDQEQEQERQVKNSCTATCQSDRTTGGDWCIKTRAGLKEWVKLIQIIVWLYHWFKELDMLNENQCWVYFEKKKDALWKSQLILLIWSELTSPLKAPLLTGPAIWPLLLLLWILLKLLRANSHYRQEPGAVFTNTVRIFSRKKSRLRTQQERGRLLVGRCCWPQFYG